MNRTTIGFAIGLIFTTTGIASPSAKAAFLNNGDAVGGAYTIQNISPGLTIDFTTHMPAAANSTTIGELTMFANHANFEWLGFDLFENAPAAAESNENGGFRLLLDVRDTNAFMPPVSWVDYHVAAREYTPIDFSNLPPEERPNEGAHKTIAHFHNTPAGYGPNPLSPQGGQNNVIQLDFGLPAAVAPGVEFTVNNILVHERDFQGHQRSFRIETQPSVPEPGTIVLALVGGLGVSACGCRRQRNRRPR